MTPQMKYEIDDCFLYFVHHIQAHDKYCSIKVIFVIQTNLYDVWCANIINNLLLSRQCYVVYDAHNFVYFSFLLTIFFFLCFMFLTCMWWKCWKLNYLFAVYVYHFYCKFDIDVLLLSFSLSFWLVNIFCWCYLIQIAYVCHCLKSILYWSVRGPMYLIDWLFLVFVYVAKKRKYCEIKWNLVSDSD